MIINKKIIENVEPEKFLKLSEFMQNKIKNDERIRLNSILKYFSFKELNYTFEDFLKDEYSKNAIEKKALYNLYFLGYESINEYAEKNNLNKYKLTENILYGFDKRSKYLFEYNNSFLELIEIDYNLQGLEIEYYKKHIEIYGEKRLLEDFRIKHNIKYPVRYEPLKEKFHLAFNGLLSEYIKYKQKGKV